MTEKCDYDLLKSYYASLKKCKPISKEEEFDLLKKAKNGDTEATNKIVESNLRFVWSVAKCYSNQGIPLLDLISEGNMGLFKALEKYDLDSGIKFITYAVYWVRLYIYNLITDKNKKNNTEVDFGDNNDLLVQEKFGDKLDSFITDDGLIDEDNDSKKKKMIEGLMKVLNKREKSVVESYFGLNNEKEMDLSEMSEKMGVSIERVRQIKKSALRKMRTEYLQLVEVGLV